MNAELLPSEAQPLATAMNYALDRMQDAFRSQGEFVANVAHELRTPLSVIALRSEAIDDPALKAKMQAAVGRTTHVVDQLLELSRLEDLSPKDDRLDLSALAKEAVELQGNAVFTSGRTIAFDEPSAIVRPCTGSADLSLIALVNLIDNAVRHTPPGTDIIVSVLPQGGIEVADTGHGIAEAQINETRRRYWRADANRSDGAGIGLSIVERIMSAMGGTMEIANRSGGGAAIRLNFKAEQPGDAGR